jgi:hypothetical protein
VTKSAEFKQVPLKAVAAQSLLPNCRNCPNLQGANLLHAQGACPVLAACQPLPHGQKKLKGSLLQFQNLESTWTKESVKEDRNGRLSSTAEEGLCWDKPERTLVRGRDQSAASNRLGIDGAVQGVFGRWSSGQVCGRSRLMRVC